MAQAVSASTRGLTTSSVTNLIRLSPEAEIRSICSIAPENIKQLSRLFAESVIESCSAIAGTSSGEALVRRIGDKRLLSPGEAFGQIDVLLGGGSNTLKRAIELKFRSKVHRLYRISMSLEAKRMSAP